MTNVEAYDYLESRAMRHGITYSDLMDITPVTVSDCPQEAAAFWETKHVSHIYPQSTHPHLADDPSNMMPEDPTPNLQRGDEVMTDGEVLTTWIDNQVDASVIDVQMQTDFVLL